MSVFDRINVLPGPPLTGTTVSSDSNRPLLGIDTQTGILYTAGAAGKWQNAGSGVLGTGGGVQLAQTPLSTLTTAQTMFTVALPAGIMNSVGRTLRIWGAGVYTSPGTTAPVFTVSAKIAAVTPVAITAAAVSTTASTNAPFEFLFNITTAATGTTGNDEAHGRFDLNIAAGAPAAAIATYLDTNTAVSSNYDHTAANTLLIQIAATLTITSVTPRQLTVEVLN